jgi:nitroimidazol reductase NimA-like FMN-containing flavoprotein (pyridoxamine 5'-phosphate oxidase superfamily)
MSTPPREVHELTRAECLELLAATTFGRVVVATAQSGTPMIRPVNYVFDRPSQSIVFRTGDGSKLHALVHSTQACFEIDDFDPASHRGWSVIIVGRTDEVTLPADQRRLELGGLINPAAGGMSHWVRIRARTVSGRRVGPAAAPDAPAG